MTSPEPSPAPQAAPSGVGGVLSIVQAIIGLAPRWLVVAAGIIAVTFIGAEAYLTIRGQWAATRESEAKSEAATSNIDELVAHDMKSWSPEKMATYRYKQCLEVEYPKQLQRDQVDFDPRKVKAVCKTQYPLAQAD